MKIAQAAATPAFRVSTRDDSRIDREIGNGDGWVDPQELAVAVATREVYDSTGIDVRPKLRSGTGSYTARDALGSYVVLDRRETARELGYVVFHEAGHVAHGDAFVRNVPDPQLELRADAYAGALIKSTGENLTQGVAFRLSRGTDALHGTPRQGAAAMVAGYRGEWW